MLIQSVGHHISFPLLLSPTTDTGLLKMTQIYYMTVRRLWSPKWVSRDSNKNAGGDAFLLETPGKENPFPCLFQLLQPASNPKAPLPCNMTHSQVLEMRTWTSWGGTLFRSPLLLNTFLEHLPLLRGSARDFEGRFLSTQSLRFRRQQ